MTQFTDLGLAEQLLKALTSEGYTTPTPIQAQAIPPILQGRDLLGAAQTGTGKTAAFALPLIQRLLTQPRRMETRSVRALILSPTRELAAQIETSIRAYAQFTTIKSTVVFGGVPVGKQIRALGQHVDILVATPGRLLDLVDQRAVSLREIEYLVLDEADQMLDLGFVHALRRIATLIPKKRQTLLFSATMPKPIREIASAYLTDPVEVSVAPVATTAEKIDQRVIFTQAGEKPALLAKTLSGPDMERAIVFTRTKHGADKVVRQLEISGIKSAAIHGNKSQGQRERALGAFRDGDLRILVATDIAARGIDVDGISHVVQFDLPNVAETYVHRIGRTARAGASGIAIAFCTPEERGDLASIEKLTRVAITPMVMSPTGTAARRRSRRRTRVAADAVSRAAVVATRAGRRANARVVPRLPSLPIMETPPMAAASVPTHPAMMRRATTGRSAARLRPPEKTVERPRKDLAASPSCSKEHSNHAPTAPGGARTDAHHA